MIRKMETKKSRIKELIKDDFLSDVNDYYNSSLQEEQERLFKKYEGDPDEVDNFKKAISLLLIHGGLILNHI